MVMVMPFSCSGKRLNRLFKSRFGRNKWSKREQIKYFIIANFVLVNRLENNLSEYLPQVQHSEEEEGEEEDQDRRRKVDNLLTALEKADACRQHKFLDQLETSGFPSLSFVYFVSRFDVIMGIVISALLASFLTVIGILVWPPTPISIISTGGDRNLTTSTKTVNPQIIIDLLTNGTTKFSSTTPTSDPKVTTTRTTTTQKINKVDPDLEEEEQVPNNNVCPGHGTLMKPPLETRHKCPIGTCSYDQFKMDAPPGTPQCDLFKVIEVDLDKEPEEKERAELKIIKCENKCGYYSLLVNDLSIFSQKYVFLPKKIPQVKTLALNNEGVLCEEVNEDSFDIQWKTLRWLRIENINSECSEIYKAIATWLTPRLELLAFDQSFISYPDADYIGEILKTNSHINTLILTNITLCMNCQIFDTITTTMTSLQTIVLVWRNPNSVHVQQQTTQLLSKTPNVIHLTSNAELSVDDLGSLTQNLVYLEKAHLVVFLESAGGGHMVDGSDDASAEFSLANISRFCSLTDLTIKLTVKGIDSPLEKGQVAIFVKDFEELDKNSVIKNLTIVSEFHELKMPTGVHKFCRQRVSLTNFQNPPYIFNCVRSL